MMQSSMEKIKSILVPIVIVFTVLTACLLLLMIFELVGGDSARQTIIKLAQASGVIAGAGLIVLGLRGIAKL